MKVLHVVGARPNFMKAAPVIEAFGRRDGVEQTLVHTGQHYDANMADVFFSQLGMPRPDVSLEVGSGSHAVQTAKIMTRFEETLVEKQPDWVVVYGDVNSTLAATLVSVKLGVPLAHVEAGLRSFDRTMPEEINRVLTDRVADLLLTPSEDGDANLLREGIDPSRIVRVGNVMIDTLVKLLPKAELPVTERLADPWTLVTLHRPSNVDDPAILERILAALVEISESLQVVFPVHPRTRKQLDALAFEPPNRDRFLLLEPLGYLECLALQKQAKVVITDSGGMQEESTFLGVPCFTLRQNTERPITIDVGTNTLVGNDLDHLKEGIQAAIEQRPRKGRIPALWEGAAGERIAEVLLQRTIR